jgi:hypothetical protein
MLILFLEDPGLISLVILHVPVSVLTRLFIGPIHRGEKAKNIVSSGTEVCGD